MGVIDFVFAILIVVLFIRIHHLKAQLAEFQQEATRLIKQLTDQLRAVKKDRVDLMKESQPVLEQVTSPSKEEEPVTTEPVPEPIPIPPPSKVPPATPVPPSTSQEIVRSAASTGKKTVSPEVGPKRSVRKPPTPSKIPPSRPAPPHSKPSNPAFQLLTGFFEPMIGPFANIWEYIVKTYYYYRDKGKLPVFFLTVMGIIALSVGFGYILQYSFTNILNETVKVLLGSVAPIGIIVVGIRLIGRHEQYRDYGSGLIGLGFILNYICIYFV